MRRIFHTLLSFMAIGLASLSAQIIERTAPFQPVSILTLKTVPSYRGKQVEWKIVCTTIDETSNAFAVVGDTVRATGDSIQARLIKYDLKYTYYKILAGSGNINDSLELQVFSKGSMQKYLHRSAAYATKPVPVYLYLPSSFSQATRIIVVMHGIDRNALAYGTQWISFATATNTLVIAPEFSEANWTSSAYGLGNMFTGSDGTGSLTIKEKWTFTIVQAIERTLARSFGLKDSSYIIWGHSAGAQFIHRMLLFAYDPMITTAIAANAGWYTAPDTTTIYPWGVKHPFLSVKRQDLVDYTMRPLVLMRGTADTLRDSNLNIDSLSDLQGKNRYQRAGYFHQKGKEISSILRWPLLDVVGVGHEYQKMAAAAVTYLTKNTALVQRDPELLPRNLLLQNFPNPFNPSTAITFTVEKPSVIAVEIFSVLGEKVSTLAEGYYERGTYTVLFSATASASGFYLCRLRDASQASVIKLLLLK